MLRSPSPKRLTPEAAEETAIAALAFLAGDEDRLSRFLAVTGLDVGQLRKSSAQKGFLSGVIAYLASDEPLLLAFAAAHGLRPEDVGAAHGVLNGPFE
jgi:hypothetical protein